MPRENMRSPVEKDTKKSCVYLRRQLKTYNRGIIGLFKEFVEKVDDLTSESILQRQRFYPERQNRKRRDISS